MTFRQLERIRRVKGIFYAVQQTFGSRVGVYRLFEDEAEVLVTPDRVEMRTFGNP